MRKNFFTKKLDIYDNRGLSLVEIMITMFIAGIAISGMVMAYTDGLTYWRKAAERMVIYNEGSIALSIIESHTRNAEFIKINAPWKEPGSRMEVKIPGRGEAHFYYLTYDKSLRWNNLTGAIGYFNRKLLPMSNFRYEEDETPYLEVQDATFTPIDPLRPMNPTTEGYRVVKISLLLNDSRGDTMTVSSVVTRWNRPL